MKRVLPVLILLVLVAWLPIQLRRGGAVESAGDSDDRLVIITPHNDSIRKEFGEAFAAHWKKETGRSLYVDWRIPGGTSEISRVIDASFAAAEDLGEEGTELDIFFGGGDYEFRKHAKKGRFVALEVFEEHPEWFTERVVPAEFSGEIYYDQAFEWVGVCVSQFGIIYNLDSIERLGSPPPRQWTDLEDPVYVGKLAMADPTKSGSITRAIEMMIQQQMQATIEAMGDTPEAREKGWKRAMNLLQALGANARYFTDSASKIPHDVSQGDAAVGTSIDFYGRSYEEKVRDRRGRSRVHWIAPEGGTSLSVDPIAVFKGAPNREIAQAFVSFCLSEDGQLIWNLEPGLEGGPRERALRRLPVRRDLYTPELLAMFTDPEALPYERTGNFVYRPELTGKTFRAIQLIFRAMCIDPHQELQKAWVRVHERGGVDEEGLEALFDVEEVGYAKVMEEIVPLLAGDDPLESTRAMTEISKHFRARYRQVAEKGGRP